MDQPKARRINDRFLLQQNPRAGGMATVYRALDLERDGAVVAVKLFDQPRIEQVVLDEVYRRESLALRELRHDNIAALLDEGTDATTRQYYLVLEWMESDLNRRMKEHPFKDWDDFAPSVGLPILEALAYAHARQVVHRDIKPANVLLDVTGSVKLGDFGISKLKRTLTRSLTLNEYVSRPFCPRELDDGSYSYTRDVFGYAMLVLCALADRAPSDYPDIPASLLSLRAPADVRNLLQRALADAPAERPENAGILLTELRNLQSARLRARRPATRCYALLHKDASSHLKNELGLPTQADIDRYVLEDLNSGTAMRAAISPNGAVAEDGAYEMMGTSLRYKIVVRLPDRDQLIITKAYRSDFDKLERWKQHLWKPPFVFQLGYHPDAAQSRAFIESLDQSLDEHAAEQRQRRAKEDEERLFRVWSDILKAKLKVEQERETPLQYTQARSNGRHVEFVLATEPDDDVIGQLRRIQLSDRRYLGGEIEDLQGNRLTLYVTYGDYASISQNGLLVFDSSAAEQALNRQSRALEQVKMDLAVRSNLKELITVPSRCREPVPIKRIDFVTNPLDESKKKAVCTALGAEDFIVVEGPPGTGKTAFIAELILQFLKKKPDARVLLTSQTHVALDNAIGRLQKANAGLTIVRIARADDPRVGAEGQPHVLERQMDQWAKSVIGRSDQFVRDWAAHRGIDQSNLLLGLRLQRLIAARKEEQHTRQELREFQSQMASATDVERVQEEVLLLRERLDAVKRLRQSIEREIMESKAMSTDPSKVSDKDLEPLIQKLLPDTDDGRQLRKIIELQSEWAERFGRGVEFTLPLIERAQVVAGTCLGMLSIRGTEGLEYDLCILDEASKATATETLVPLSRCRRWVLVGDSKQLPPFEDELSRSQHLRERYDLKLEDIRETLFDRLARDLPAGCRTMLDVQYRMVAPIGNLISSCFYGGQLKSARTTPDPFITSFLGRPVVWLTTGLVEDRAEKKIGKSFANPREVWTIEDFLLNLNDELTRAGRKLEVAVLTGYSAQLEALRRALNGRRDQLRNIDVFCMTVDSVQGREVDLVIYSLTRSNRVGQLGFLSHDARINVALSRARDGLLIVGDHGFIESAVDGHPLKRVLSHIKANPAECEMQKVDLK